MSLPELVPPLWQRDHLLPGTPGLSVHAGPTSAAANRPPLNPCICHALARPARPALRCRAAAAAQAELAAAKPEQRHKNRKSRGTQRSLDALGERGVPAAVLGSLERTLNGAGFGACRFKLGGLEAGLSAGRGPGVLWLRNLFPVRQRGRRAFWRDAFDLEELGRVTPEAVEAALRLAGELRGGGYADTPVVFVPLDRGAPEFDCFAQCVVGIDAYKLVRDATDEARGFDPRTHFACVASHGLGGPGGKILTTTFRCARGGGAPISS